MSNSHATLNQLLFHYEFQVLGVRTIQAEPGKAVWQIDCPSGPVALKRLHHNRERSLFTLAAQQHVAQRGGNVADIVPTRNGELLVEVGDGLYAAFDWLTGRHPRPGNADDLATMVRALAQFHAAADGFTPPPGSRPSSKLGRWPHLYTTMCQQLDQFRGLLLRQAGTRATSMLQLFAVCFRQGKDALAALEASDYSERCRQAASNGPLCHQDYGERNCLITPRQAYVIDLDGLTYDLQTRDVRKILYKVAMTRGRWDGGIVRTLLQWYEAVRPIHPVDRRLLEIDLRFPHGFHAVVKNLRKGPVSLAEIQSAAAMELAKLDMLGPM